MSEPSFEEIFREVGVKAGVRNLLRRQNGDDSYLYKKSKNGLFRIRKSPFLLKKGCQLSDSPFDCIYGY